MGVVARDHHDGRMHHHRVRTLSCTHGKRETDRPADCTLVTHIGTATADTDDGQHRTPPAGLWHHHQPPLPAHIQPLVLSGMHRPANQPGSAYQLDSNIVCMHFLAGIDTSGQLCQHHPQQNTQGHRNQSETGHHTPASLIERHLRNLPERNAPCAGSKPERPYPLHARLVRMGKLAGPGCLKRFTLYITRNRTGIPFLPRTNVFASFCQYTARIQQTDGYRTTNLRHRQRIARNMVEKRNIARIDRRDKRHPLLRPQYPKRAESVRNRANASNRPPMQFTREIIHSDPFLIELQRARA